MFAFIKHSGKQFKISEGSIITVNKIPQEKGTEINLEEICCIIGQDNNISFSPKGKVICEVLCQTRTKKILVFKQRPKKGYRRKKSHRQDITKLLVKKIELA